MDQYGTFDIWPISFYIKVGIHKRKLCKIIFNKSDLTEYTYIGILVWYL